MNTQQVGQSLMLVNVTSDHRSIIIESRSCILIRRQVLPDDDDDS